MIYRVEILCGHRDRFDPKCSSCWTHGNAETANAPPVGIRANVEVAAAEARKLARDTGWIFIGGKWLCPSCKPKPDPVA